MALEDTQKDKKTNNFGCTNRQKSNQESHFVPFVDAEEAWFWFIQAQEAKNEGARFTAGLSLTPRPCEPTDILKILDTLYRNRRLERDHLLVLRHYGRRQLAPDTRRVKEARAGMLWKEAMDRIEPVLLRKKIIREHSVFEKLEKSHKRPETLKCSKPNPFWVHGATVHAGLNGGQKRAPSSC